MWDLFIGIGNPLLFTVILLYKNNFETYVINMLHFGYVFYDSIRIPTMEEFLYQNKMNISFLQKLLPKEFINYIF